MRCCTTKDFKINEVVVAARDEWWPRRALQVVPASAKSSAVHLCISCRAAPVLASTQLDAIAHADGIIGVAPRDCLRQLPAAQTEPAPLCGYCAAGVRQQAHEQRGGRQGADSRHQRWSTTSLLAQTTLAAPQVLEWAQREFRREVAWSKPDAQVPLAKACLIIALEEAAAAELNQDLPYSGWVRQGLQGGPPRRPPGCRRAGIALRGPDARALPALAGDWTATSKGGSSRSAARRRPATACPPRPAAQLPGQPLHLEPGEAGRAGSRGQRALQASHRPRPAGSHRQAGRPLCRGSRGGGGGGRQRRRQRCRQWRAWQRSAAPQLCIRRAAPHQRRGRVGRGVCRPP
jgi:hypothetical protein